MRRTVWMFLLGLGMVLSCAAAPPQHGSGNVTFTLACARGITATLDQVTLYNDPRSNATLSSLCATPSLSCDSNTTKLVCTPDGFTALWYSAGDTTLPAGGLHVTDSKGNTQNCIAEGGVPSKFSCTTILNKGVTLSVSSK